MSRLSTDIKPGETIVLLHSSGGRTMVVHEVTEEGVRERVEPSQQKYVSEHRFIHVRKVRSAEAAHELVGRLKQIRDETGAAIRALDNEAQRRYRDAVSDYEMWEDEK